MVHKKHRPGEAIERIRSSHKPDKWPWPMPVVKDGTMFWLLHAGVELTKTDSRTHAYNLFEAARQIWPALSDYDKKLVQDCLVKPVEDLHELARFEDEQYFLGRTLGIIKPKESA